MYRIRLATGHETVFETLEDIARGVSTGTITPECAVFHAKAGKWLPITVHPLYKQALAIAEAMAAKPARPKRVSRPLPRVDTPSPERTAPASTRVAGRDLRSRGAPPPVEEPSPAAHELPSAPDAGVAADAQHEAASRPKAAGRSPEEGAEAPSQAPKLNDGLLDLGPIAPAKAVPSSELIIERGAPAPDADMPVTEAPPVEVRKSPDPPAPPATVEPAPALSSDAPDNKLVALPADGALEAIPKEASYKVPDSKPLKRANGPLPIGAVLGDGDDESKVDAMLPPPSRSPERRVSGAQHVVTADRSGPHPKVVPADRSGPHARPRPARRDPFGHSAQKGRHKTPLIAAGFVGLIAVGWLLKSFVFAGGADSAEGATPLSATIAAAQEPGDTRRTSSPVDSQRDEATVLDSLQREATSEEIPLPAIDVPSVSEYATAYRSARTELDIALAAVDVAGMLAPDRWSTGTGARATQLDVRIMRRALRAFRAREAEIEALRAEGELSLKETTPQVRRADLMLSALDSLFGWMVSQAGQYVMVDDAIVFRGDSSQESTYRTLKQRVLDEVRRPEPAPPSVAHLVRAIDSALFPASSFIPLEPSLPALSLPADTSS